MTLECLPAEDRMQLVDGLQREEDTGEAERGYCHRLGYRVVPGGPKGKDDHPQGTLVAGEVDVVIVPSLTM